MISNRHSTVEQRIGSIVDKGLSNGELMLELACRGTAEQAGTDVIRRHTGPLGSPNGLLKVGVVDRANFNRVNLYPQELLQIFYESKVAVGMLHGGH
jgi:hypothetical protein